MNSFYEVLNKVVIELKGDSGYSTEATREAIMDIVKELVINLANYLHAQEHWNHMESTGCKTAHYIRARVILGIFDE